MPDEEYITLHFDPRLRVAGEVIQGEVHLHFPGVLDAKVEEVHVKLRGSVYTRVTQQNFQNGQESQMHSRSDRIQLVQETASIWTSGSAVYPPPGTHVLRLPFQFVLPPNLPPSCDYSGYQRKGIVGYFIEAVGERPGLHFNKRVLTPFAVLPADPRGAQLKDMLVHGWRGGWRTVEKQNDIRRGIFGDYAHVKMTLVLPDMEVFPVLTPIPFTLNVITTTKTMKMDDTPDDEPIFPAPPIRPNEPEFELSREVYVRAGLWHASDSNNFVSHVGGLGPDLPPQAYAAVQIETLDKVWIPGHEHHDEKKHRGQWRQEVNMKSFMRLTCPPAFDTANFKVNYHMRLKVDFPGIGNDLKVEFPVNLASSMHPVQGPVVWDGPPPVLDLPPDYYATNDWAQDNRGADY